MVTTAPTDADYFEISTNTITAADTIAYYNFTGVLQYVRFRWTNDTGNTGVIDKILYRQ
jgi:hypothetical protein